MKVEKLMSRDVLACRSTDSLNKAAKLMWDGDCGIVPIVDAVSRVVGVITDRDVCMAAYTRGKRLDEITVASAMATNVRTCRSDDLLEAALDTMRTYQVRRLPVVDAGGRLIGMLSMNDVARFAADERGMRFPGLELDDVAATIATICQPRCHPETALVKP